ncbi:hypothetical protein [Prosthecobacter dejongeii]|uniref:Uncharacterized protein n=1 Tax=Prosthecobacter dejongeii TaxID=48465 RepID=A0A7W7YJ38_9BACT|nr:hypothetical protein [Prosthecobacter dejongeii]MBB5037123.1 hypothetical protein [Prosthecobacter dejongeii]
MSTPHILQIAAGIGLPTLAAIGLALASKTQHHAEALRCQALLKEEEQTQPATPPVKHRRQRVFFKELTDSQALFRDFAAALVLGLLFIACLILLGGWSR